MVAAVNPCGFMMLPAYLVLYLGLKEADFAQRSVVGRVLRAILVAGSVSLGFGLLFALAGLVISAGGRYLMAATPWFGVLIGLALVALAPFQLAGRGVSADVFERLAQRGGDPKVATPRGFFLFGLAHGAALLSCTLPVFMIVVGSGLASGDWFRGVLQFVSYGLGLATVFVALTVALALFKQGVATNLRRAVPYVRHAAAVLLMLAGVYLDTYRWPSVGWQSG
jgi:cytochrome c-type biogenesis protein